MVWSGTLLRWLLGDRPRIRPSEGRILQAKTGDRLLWKGRLFQVCAREWSSHSQGAELLLEMLAMDDATPAVCKVEVLASVRGEIQRQVTWTMDQMDCILAECDILVLPHHDETMLP